MSETRTILAARWQHFDERLQSACSRSGRRREEVTVIAVTKTASVEVAAELIEFGVHDLGESRPQELWRKAARLPATVRWHLVGHLQRNKIERTLPLAHLIHSVDSFRLLAALEGQAAKQGRVVDVLLEVNASREPNKYGFPPEEVANILPHLQSLRQVRVKGLMTLAALADEAERSRPTFATLRQLRDRLGERVPPPHGLVELSMGMSNDFEVAIEEGATLVRIGTALFEGLSQPSTEIPE